MSQSRLLLWTFRLVWLLQPLAAVPLLGDATRSQPAAGRVVIAVVAWAVWAVTLLATLVPTTVSLTVVRLLVPVTPFAVVVAAVGGDARGWTVAVALAATTIATLVC